MKSLVVYLAGFAAIGLIVVLLVLRAKARRGLQGRQNDVHQLKPGKVFREFELQTTYSEQALAKLRQFFVDQKFRLVDNVAEGIIAYSGKSENATLSGWLNIDPMLLPIRIVVKSSATHRIVLRMDDDYGFQVLNEAQKAKFQEKNDVKFGFFERGIREVLGE